MEGIGWVDGQETPGLTDVVDQCGAEVAMPDSLAACRHGIEDVASAAALMSLDPKAASGGRPAMTGYPQRTRTEVGRRKRYRLQHRLTLRGRLSALLDLCYYS